MIQRIQTIYLFLAAVAAIAFLFVPFGKINMNGFSNRKLQMKVIAVAILLSIALIGLSVYAIVLHQKDQYQFGPRLSFLCLFLCLIFLAYKGVKHDEQLVKSMDRLR
ncbi:MAG: DUF4293 family protein [Sphingobacteriales bacterium]|nr:DUF4293 family protein [Sphingobacteriales bacterium]